MHAQQCEALSLLAEASTKGSKPASGDANRIRRFLMIESKAPAAMRRQHLLTPYIDCNTCHTFMLRDIRIFASRPAGR